LKPLHFTPRSALSRFPRQSPETAFQKKRARKGKCAARKSAASNEARKTAPQNRAKNAALAGGASLSAVSALI